MKPTAEKQIEFLQNLQRLLSEGQFVATYKYALLLALADISVEHGSDSGDAWVIDTRLIAEKFVRYYWRQCIPYMPVGVSKGAVLKQNTGRPAAVLQSVGEVRSEVNSIAAAMRQTDKWKHLVRDVNQIVLKMPLWKLQTVGTSKLDFLYENHGKGREIELRPGVAYCFRQFYGLITELVRNAWILYVRRHNDRVLGPVSDLSEFLFGSERQNLSAIQPILVDLQQGRCFYCDGSLRRGAAHVDHFIAWSRYPVDLGHNFVLSHQNCNSAKADHLAAAEHLWMWSSRNEEYGSQLADEFTRIELPYDLQASRRIARWAYEQTQAVNGLTWLAGNRFVPLNPRWGDFLNV